jgi:3-dehydroquinate dehydratase-2
VVVLNGANLNLLGTREPEIYGHDMLLDAEALARAEARRYGVEVDFRQSNHEGVLVDAIQEVRTTALGIVINPAGFTHTSVVIHDALATVDGPVLEVHVTNIHRREEWRKTSHVSTVADGVVMGCGIQGYAFGVARVCHLAGLSPHDAPATHH